MEDTKRVALYARVSSEKQAEELTIASQVAGGVAAAATGVQEGVENATRAPLSTVAEAPRQIGIITEKVKEQFFAKNVPFGSIIYREAKKNDLPPELLAADQRNQPDRCVRQIMLEIGYVIFAGFGIEQMRARQVCLAASQGDQAPLGADVG